MTEALTPIMQFIEDDIKLFYDYFPNVFNWNQIKWIVSDSCAAYYKPKDKTITLWVDIINNDYVRFHEMGHVIHHLLFDWKRFHFKTDYLDITCNLYWGVPECKRNYIESFADAFSDTMLRLKNPNCAMFDHNKKIIKLLGGVR